MLTNYWIIAFLPHFNLGDTTANRYYVQAGQSWPRKSAFHDQVYREHDVETEEVRVWIGSCSTANTRKVFAEGVLQPWRPAEVIPHGKTTVCWRRLKFDGRLTQVVQQVGRWSIIVLKRAYLTRTFPYKCIYTSSQ